MKRLNLMLVGCLALLVPLVAAARASVEPPFPPGGCRYVEAGRPGPAGNRLFIDDNFGGVGLRREGTAVVAYSPRTEKDAVLQCEGPQATVHNIDRIVYRPPGGGDPPRIAHALEVDLSGGLFQPGASRDHAPGGREIEIVAEFPAEPRERWSSIFVTGSDLGDWFRIGALPRGRTGVNLDPRRDHYRYDADLIVSAALDAHFKLKGGEGDDVVAATGESVEFVGPIRQGSLSVIGGGGSDTIHGGPERDIFSGQGGGDTIYGWQGRDRLKGEDGNDSLFGGPGKDELHAGYDESRPFDDYLSGGGDRDFLYALDRNSDEVSCGNGRDHAYVDAVDRWSRSTCETPHGPDFK